MERRQIGPVAWMTEASEEDEIDGREHQGLMSLNDSGTPKSPWWTKSYIVDYVVTAGLYALVGILYFWVPIFQRFLPGPQYYPYPYTGTEIVPSWALIIICMVGPITIFAGSQYFKRSPHDLHNSILGLFQGLSMALLTTEALKLAAGEYRPYYEAVVTDLAEGTVSQSVAKDAQQSFPSGHSSLSFCAMVYLSMYISANLRVFAKKSDGAMWKAVLSLLPLVVSCFVAISRVDDYHHDFTDITAGSIMGAAFGVYSWLLNYQSPFSAAPARPRLRVKVVEFTSI